MVPCAGHGRLPSPQSLPKLCQEQPPWKADAEAMYPWGELRHEAFCCVCALYDSYSQCKVKKLQSHNRYCALLYDQSVFARVECTSGLKFKFDGTSHAHRPYKPYLASVGNSLASGPPPPPPRQSYMLLLANLHARPPSQVKLHGAASGDCVVYVKLCIRLLEVHCLVFHMHSIERTSMKDAGG